jgi:hypothetical protein
MDNSWIPQNEEDWFCWLSSEEEKTKKAFLAKPATLIANYRNEIATTRDYEGREILELLQNAADQARESGVLGRVIIELLPEGLVIANTGAAFSIGGVLSLENAHLSPKRHKLKKFIGNKGLGFRSVLNWSHTPIINSGKLKLVYSRKFLESQLEKLKQQSTELAEFVSKESHLENELVAPVLPFPGFSSKPSILHLLDNDNSILLNERCEHWREKGYDTVIAMPFDRAEYFKSACDQIELLSPEFLLFVRNLEEVKFQVNGKEERTWTADSDGDTTVILESGQTLNIFKVHTIQGEIPENHLEHDEIGPINFELIVAVPEFDKAEIPKTFPLFTYFPTAIALPLPIACHATLELDQSRNHVLNRSSNKYVLAKLAEYIAKVAEEKAIQTPDGVNAGYKLLMALESYPPSLEKLAFPEKLIEEASKRAIVPAISGIAVLPLEAMAIPGASKTWLPVSSFGDIVQVLNKNETEFFKKLKVESISDDVLRKRFTKLSYLSVEQRINLIVGILENKISPETHTSSLLLATDLTSLPDKATVFIASGKETQPSLPEWVTLWFLDPTMYKGLLDKLNIKESRELQRKLSTFQLIEYSFGGLINRIVAFSNREKRQRPALYQKVNKQLLNSLFNLYTVEIKTGNTPKLPPKLNVYLPSQGDSYIPANNLYFGKEYLPYGNIVQSLYENWDLNKLILEPKKFEFTESTPILTEFLNWLGVTTYPREVNSKESDKAYLLFVLDRIKYPAHFEDFNYSSREELTGVMVQSVKSVDGLTNIIKYADQVAIVAWLALDRRASEWMRGGLQEAVLLVKKSGFPNLRRYKGTLPSYIKWQLETSVWLVDKNNKLLRPKDCILGERAIESLFPRPVKPDVSDLQLFGINDSDLISGWRHSGVHTSLAELELSDIYERLLELPAKQPSGKLSRTLYRWLLDASEIALGEGGIAKDNFLAKGEMWGAFGKEEGYYPISELNYVDTDGLPQVLLDSLKIVDLPHRRGSEKVKAVFGISPIDRNAIKQELKDFRLALDINPEFQQAKPYWFSLRSSQTSQTQSLSKLKRLTLKVCSELSAKFKYKELEFDFFYSDWGWLLSEDILYVRCSADEIVNPASDLLADAIGEAIASIFRIADGGEFARMFLCQTQNRKKLLERMRGEAAVEDMEKIIVQFGEDEIIDSLPKLSFPGDIQDPLKIDRYTEVKNNETSIVKESVIQSDNKITKETNTKLISIEQKQHIQNNAPIRHKLRVQRITKSIAGNVTSYQVTDYDFVEKKIFEIEENFQPPRYPLRVGHLMGSDAPGCDILSFDCIKKRQMFKEGTDRNLNNVSRFIEVKGRRSKNSEIELRGNEKDAAVNYGKRYYLYRLFRTDENKHMLHILQQPLAAKEAIESSIYVHMDRAKNTIEYEINGGL